MAMARQTPARTRLRLVPEDETDQQLEAAAELEPLLTEVHARLPDPDPMALVGFVSGLIAATDGRHGFADHSPAALIDLVEAFLELDLPETTAVLQVMSRFLRDAHVRRRIRATLDHRSATLPRWLENLDDTTVSDAFRLVAAIDATTGLALGVTWPDGTETCCVALFGRGTNPAIRDALPSPWPLDETARRLHELGRAQSGFGFEPLDLRVARRLLSRAVTHSILHPKTVETDTWPALRPFIEWLSLAAAQPPS